MRIVSWNMGCAPPMAKKFRQRHADAWDFLLRELRPDIALVQEALFSASPAPSVGQLFWSKDRGLDSGTAVFVRSDASLGLAEVEMVSAGSYVAGVELPLGDASMLFASAHVGPKNYRKHLRTLAGTMHAIAAGRRFVFGGDLNAARNIDVVYGGRWYQRYFSDLEQRGFHDCHWALHGREIQSFWGRQARHEYQCDHLFTDTETARLVQSCAIVSSPTIHDLSDHAPMVLELRALREETSRANTGLQPTTAD